MRTRTQGSARALRRLRFWRLRQRATRQLCRQRTPTGLRRAAGPMLPGALRPAASPQASSVPPIPIRRPHRPYPCRSPCRSVCCMTGDNAGWVNAGRAEIFWEATGNPSGIPVLFLHGGPGASLGQGYRTRHDTSKFRTVGLDQRGCGRSTPAAQDDLGSLPANTTHALVEDIEAVRKNLGIGKWIVTGVSWGSTLALAYALQHRARRPGLDGRTCGRR